MLLIMSHECLCFLLNKRTLKYEKLRWSFNWKRQALRSQLVYGWFLNPMETPLANFIYWKSTNVVATISNVKHSFFVSNQKLTMNETKGNKVSEVVLECKLRSSTAKPIKSIRNAKNQQKPNVIRIPFQFIVLPHLFSCLFIIICICIFIFLFLSRQ